MADVINVDWLNENTFRNYPLVDGASRVAASGAVLPNGLLADLSISVPLGSLDPSRAFIRRVYGFSAGVVITLGDIASPSTDLATATVFTADHVRGKNYPLAGVPGTVLDGANGRITIGLPEAVAQCSMGLFDFAANPEATRLVVSCIRPLLTGIRGIVVRGADGSVSTIYEGTLTLKAGENVALDYDPSDKSVTVSSTVLVTPADLAESGSGCDESLEGLKTPILTINGIKPDDKGNFTLTGRDSTVFEPISGGTGSTLSGLTAHDAAASPCCGCTQLAELRDNLQNMEDMRTQLLTAAEQIQARIANLSAIILNAGLNPPSSPAEDAKPDCWWWLPIGPGGYGAVVPCQ
jgi:hypothetical protein